MRRKRSTTNHVKHVILEHVKSTKTTICYKELAGRVGLIPIALFRVLRKIGKDAVLTGRPLLDAWVVNADSGMPGDYFFEQKIELGYLDKDVDWSHFWFIELDKFWN